MSDATQAFRALSPDEILDAVESLGYFCDGRLLALNSYENRVYQVGIEDAEPLIAKFYRPARWSDEAIREEHDFTLALAAEEIPVVAPLVCDGETLHHHGPFRFALYPRRGGRTPELDSPEQLEIIGRFLARIHLLGEAQPFAHRPSIDLDSYVVEPREFLLGSGFIPAALEPAYSSITADLLATLREKFASAKHIQTLRIHGDCHPSNLLYRDETPHIVDFDDARNGPAVQDLWMFLSGDRSYANARLFDLLDGYTQFREFDPRELILIEPLRTMRLIHYAAWLARRWEDPAFQQAFPWFDSPRYWDEHVLALREQMSALNEPALVWD
jgi:Ser/Thr protein kinase RdoA (MazF antagonist)